MILSPGWSLRDCAVEWDQPEREMAESSPPSFPQSEFIGLC
jgi:hypothetical protein